MLCNDEHKILHTFTHFLWIIEERFRKICFKMNYAFLAVHTVMKVAIIAKNIVAHTHSGFFLAMLSHLQN